MSNELTSLSRVLDSLRDDHRVPGVVGSLLLPDTSLCCASKGVRMRGSIEGLNPSDQWHIGSCGKLLTSWLCTQAVGGETPCWSRPVGEIFADIATMDPTWMHITVQDLLTHHVNVRRDLSIRQMFKHWNDGNEPQIQRSEIATIALSGKTDRLTAPRYSNLGYILVGAAIDRLFGSDFESLLLSHLHRSFGVESLGFGPPPRVRGHGARVRLGPIAVGLSSGRLPSDRYSDNPLVYASAGGMHIALGDLTTILAEVFLAGDGSPNAALADAILKSVFTQVTSRVAHHKTDLDLYTLVGSNTLWSSAIVIDKVRRSCAVVIANDGRRRVVSATALAAQRLLLSR
ncbi:serine hydrolase [Candidatus Poriferisodalis sp.]|uniref:serine hydrolase n=1 Tax=Candidatus Poriferisodalis sp. TaxID=3101277 RepID=UPI003B023413